jgi:hypothetical protein
MGAVISNEVRDLFQKCITTRFLKRLDNKGDPRGCHIFVVPFLIVRPQESPQRLFYLRHSCSLARAFLRLFAKSALNSRRKVASNHD